jgi:hypothetical protein
MTAGMQRAGTSRTHARLWRERSWWFFCLAVLFLKFAIFMIDPNPQLFLGDSASYIWTAVSGWIPPDRSYFYGYIIRWLAISTGSLTLLLLVQTFASAVTAIVIAYTCRRNLNLAAWPAYSIGILCAIDPLQLVWERYVMTETISLLLYAVMLNFAFEYLRTRAMRHLVIVQSLGVVLISFRMSYLLIIQIWAALKKDRPKFNIRLRQARMAAAHFAVSVGLMLLLHTGYKHAYAALSQRSPEYQHTTGLHLLAFWAPILQETDTTDERLRSVIRRGDEFGIKDLARREAQRFSPGHLVAEWQKLEPDAEEADRIAKATALRALARAPVSVAALALRTYIGYWGIDLMVRHAKYDLGHTDLSPEQAALLAKLFDWVTPPNITAQPLTLTQRFFTAAWPYYFLLLVSPVVCLMAMCRADNWSIALVLFAHSGFLIVTLSVFATAPSVRYLQPVSICCLLSFAALWAAPAKAGTGEARAAAVAM